MSILYPIYTPEKHICLGELIETDGKFAIRVKKPGKNDYEILPVENLLSIIFHTEESKIAASRAPEASV